MIVLAVRLSSAQLSRAPGLAMMEPGISLFNLRSNCSVLPCCLLEVSFTLRGVRSMIRDPITVGSWDTARRRCSKWRSGTALRTVLEDLCGKPGADWQRILREIYG